MNIRTCFIAVVCLSVIPGSGAISIGRGQEPEASQAAAETVADQPVADQPAAEELSFAFDRTPWREVIRWIADEGGLALQFEDLPTGSFSYRDPRQYSLQGALDRLNLFLLPQGYTLVRSGQLLSLINLANPRSLQQLDALAPLVTPAELDRLDENEVVKCMFSLGELTVNEAQEELSALQLMTTPSAFQRTGQLLITDVVSKLKSVRAVLEAFQDDDLGNGAVMKSFALQHVTAEDILQVARPHLGLATGEMIGIDVSLSADPRGTHLFVTGAEDRVKLLEGLVQALDQPTGQVSTADGVTELRTHMVAGGNAQLVYDVLQTLLAGKSLRLSLDRAAGSIVALASPEVQAEIEQTVAQMQASEPAFEVIQLKTVDPYMAITLLEQMWLSEQSERRRDDPPVDMPKLDADPGNRRLFVRAKPREIEQIKQMIERLETQGQTAGDSLRMLPWRGPSAVRLLETAAKFWRQENPILLFPSERGEEDSAPRERIVGQSSAQSSRFVTTASARGSDTARILTDNLKSQAPAIRCQLTAQGLLVESEDVAALDAFEQHLRAISGPAERSPAPPTVYYLQYTKPDDALRMLAELLDGGESAKDGEAGTLVNGYVGSSSSFLGSIVSSRDGTSTMMAGTITVVADSRLNRLIAQGTSRDMEMIEKYLEIIDKDTSIADVKTYGRSHVIELQNTQASVVAESIRAAFAGRVAAAAPAGGSSAARGTPNAPSDDRSSRENNQGGEGDERRSSSSSRSSSGGQAPRNLEPTMTVAVHEPSNSLIITAPDQLVAEVQQLVEQIDSRSEQTVEILSPSSTAVLQAILQPSSQSSRSSSSSSSRSRSSSSSQFWDMIRSRSSR